MEVDDVARFAKIAHLPSMAAFPKLRDFGKSRYIISHSVFQEMSAEKSFARPFSAFSSFGVFRVFSGLPPASFQKGCNTQLNCRDGPLSPDYFEIISSDFFRVALLVNCIELQAINHIRGKAAGR